MNTVCAFETMGKEVEEIENSGTYLIHADEELCVTRLKAFESDAYACKREVEPVKPQSTQFLSIQIILILLHFFLSELVVVDYLL